MVKRIKVDVQPFDAFKDFAPYTKRIRALCDGVVKSAIEIGQELLKAQAGKANKGTGIFQRWVKEEVGFSIQQAHNFMNAAKMFGGEHQKFGCSITDTAMYVLAAPSAPEPAREAAIGIAEQGGRVTHKKAVELVETYREPSDDEFVLLTELAKWAKTLHREYERYPVKWRTDFVKETRRVLELVEDASE